VNVWSNIWLKAEGSQSSRSCEWKTWLFLLPFFHHQPYTGKILFTTK
jgi:hypothetical protein